jgi:hypothetical protein
LEDSVDTLGRWMSHRVAELMERAEQADMEEEKEAAKRECTELILRVWERREFWPCGQPVGNLSTFLNAVAPEPYSSQRENGGPPEPSWIKALPRFRNLQEREDQIVVDAAIADLNLDQDREWLKEHPDALSEEERRTITWLINQQERLQSNYYKLDNQNVPNFAALPPEERSQLALATLDKINSERQKILAAIKETIDTQYST